MPVHAYICLVSVLRTWDEVNYGFFLFDRFLEVPMFWAGGDQSVLHPTDTTSGLPDDLEAHFASLNLGGSSFCS